MIIVSVDMGNDGFKVVASVTRDGDQWCALAGANVQTGVVGLGDTVTQAVNNLRSELRSRIITKGI